MANRWSIFSDDDNGDVQKATTQDAIAVTNELNDLKSKIGQMQILKEKLGNTAELNDCEQGRQFIDECRQMIAHAAELQPIAETKKVAKKADEVAEKMEDISSSTLGI